MVSISDHKRIPGWESLKSSYALDHRSLAVYRIGVGLVILIDLIRRLQHSTIFYTDAGVLPRNDAIAGYSSGRWSLLLMNGTPSFAHAFIFLGILAAMAMILGWKTRPMTIALWVILISVQVRNTHLLNGGDTLLRVSMFWAMFLPLGKMWSMDSRTAADYEPTRQNMYMRVLSVAGFALIFQHASMYWFTVMMKTGTKWREDGTALYYALGPRELTQPAGDWMFQNAPHSLLAFITFATLIMEFAVPIMLLLPVRNGFLRTVAVLLIISLHFGIATTMLVGMFPLISIASALGILPTWFWESLMPWVKAAISRDHAVRHPLRHDTLVPAHADMGQKIDNASLNFAFQPHRFLFSRSTLANIVCAAAIVLMTLWNISAVSSYAMPSEAKNAAIATGLYQNWSMFAPQPQLNTRWFVAEGELKSGDKIDLMMPIVQKNMSIQQPTVWDQSNDVQLQDKYWRKYFSSIRGKKTPMLRFAAYSCRSWNAANSGEDRLVRVRLTRGSAKTLPNSERAKPVYDEIGSWKCR